MKTILKVGLATVGGGFILMMVIGFFAARPPSDTLNVTQESDASDVLLARCGKPSLDDSTAYDNPRPLIPSRKIEYKAKKLRFLFIPGYGAKVGEPPPYRWKLIGITDMTARDPSKARVVPPHEAVTRMPCWGAK